MEAYTINAGWCKGCGICVAFCPKKALGLLGDKAVHDPELCVLCGMCELYCPDLAIRIDKPARKGKAGKEAGA
ncbi:MAG: 4Fe-4S binding protein [Desulfovibrio sp.]|jgi:2-oxoglutarate ferredoxin oxidoreductase subunit delta|nr:4Fe-4S binding protein [Desulfovibrio sp.]